MEDPAIAAMCDGKEPACKKKCTGLQEQAQEKKKNCPCKEDTDFCDIVCSLQAAWILSLAAGEVDPAFIYQHGPPHFSRGHKSRRKAAQNPLQSLHRERYYVYFLEIAWK
jgi:hypothetical protein